MDGNGMNQYFLGADLGGTKTRVMIADSHGKLAGFGESGPGNHESIGYEGFKKNLNLATTLALEKAGLNPQSISAAGFGIAGYDWPIEFQPTMDIIDTLGLNCPVGLVNDSELGVYSGSPRGWGVAVVSGTGCNCRGWDESRTKFGRVTGGGLEFGEFGGASEMMFMAGRAVAYEWTGRGPATALTAALIEKFGVKNLHDLLQGFICHQFGLDAADVPLVFKVAAQGDRVMLDLIRWTGRELGEMANTVIRQLQFEEVDFDLVQIGSMFDGSPLLDQEMQKVVQTIAPRVHFIRTKAPPVMGAVILAMHKGGIQPSAEVRGELTDSIAALHGNNVREER
jgi:N-acetylglucosamine kinase-like BadF-type ATPase